MRALLCACKCSQIWLIYIALYTSVKQTTGSWQHNCSAYLCSAELAVTAHVLFFVFFLSLNHCPPEKTKQKQNKAMFSSKMWIQSHGFMPLCCLLGSAADDSVCAMFSLTLKKFSYATKKRSKLLEWGWRFFCFYCGIIISALVHPLNASTESSITPL